MRWQKAELAPVGFEVDPGASPDAGRHARDVRPRPIV